MKKLLILFTLILSLVVIGCSNDDVSITVENNSVDVYAVGSISGNATYWKNNQQIPLDNGGYSVTFASEIFVENNNTYIFGESIPNQDNNPSENPAILFWKNEVLTDLVMDISEPNFEIFSISDFFISNEDIYILSILKHITNPSDFKLVYWKNGVKTDLVQNTEPIGGQIGVINNDVYVLTELNGNYGIFVNNTFTPLNPNFGSKIMETGENEVHIYGQFPYSTDGYYYNFNTGLETITPYYVIELDTDQNDVYTLALYNGGSFLEEILKNNSTYYQATNDFIIDDFEVYNGNLYVIEREINNSNNQQILIANGLPLITVNNADFPGNNFINQMFIYQN